MKRHLSFRLQSEQCTVQGIQIQMKALLKDPKCLQDTFCTPSASDRHMCPDVWLNPHESRFFFYPNKSVIPVQLVLRRLEHLLYCLLGCFYSTLPSQSARFFFLFLYLVVKSVYLHTHGLCEKFPSCFYPRFIQLLPCLLEIRVGELQSHVFQIAYCSGSRDKHLARRRCVITYWADPNHARR